MPLCSTCRSEAETTTVGPPPSRFEQLLARIVGSSGPPDHSLDLGESCSRCGSEGSD